MSEKNFNKDLKYDWDDTEIINVFNNAVKSHRTKNNQNNVKKKSDAPDVDLTADSTNMCNMTTTKLSQLSSNQGDSINQKRKVESLSRSKPILSERRVGTSSKKSALDTSAKNNSEPEFTSFEPSSSTAFEGAGSFSSNNIGLAKEETSSHTGNESEGPSATIANPSLDINNSFNSMLMAWYQSGYATGYYVAEQHYLNAQKKDPKS